MKHIFKNLFVLLCLLATGSMSSLAQVRATFTYRNGTADSSILQLENKGDYSRLMIPKERLADGIEAVTLSASASDAKAGDDGYYIFPDGALIAFNEKADGKYEASKLPMAFFGFKTLHGCYVAIVKGLRYEYKLIAEKHGNTFSLSQRYDFKHLTPYEDLVVDFYPLQGKDADYSGMARTYRHYQLERGEVRPIKERVKTNPYLAYAVYAPEIRIRQGWKPVPTPVKEQTLQTEPKMKVKVTFKRVQEIADALKKAGVDKAELCLVGWNVRGHDGRWPTPWPVEPALGGEKGLRKLITHVHKEGFQIVGHSNSGDAYRISPDWNEADIAKNPDGSLQKSEYAWSGGQMYNLCYKPSYEKFVQRNHKYMAGLGFRGLHYIDVLTNVYPTECYDSLHPLNHKEAAQYAILHMKDGAEKMGGAASEGAVDHVAGIEDYVLYVTFKNVKDNHYPDNLVNAYVPVWHIVYNGIILANPATNTINCTIKDWDEAMKVVEYGGRPTYYFYSAFLDNGNNWMGNTDLKCGTQKELDQAVTAIKKGYEYLQQMGYLQYEFMDRHEPLAKNVYMTTYSDGSKVICNYSNAPFSYNGNTIDSHGWKLIK